MGGKGYLGLVLVVTSQETKIEEARQPAGVPCTTCRNSDIESLRCRSEDVQLEAYPFTEQNTRNRKPKLRF